jgi:hypothetical protein
MFRPRPCFTTRSPPGPLTSLFPFLIFEIKPPQGNNKPYSVCTEAAYVQAITATISSACSYDILQDQIDAQMFQTRITLPERHFPLLFSGIMIGPIWWMFVSKLYRKRDVGGNLKRFYVRVARPGANERLGHIVGLMNRFHLSTRSPKRYANTT